MSDITLIFITISIIIITIIIISSSSSSSISSNIWLKGNIRAKRYMGNYIYLKLNH